MAYLVDTNVLLRLLEPGTPAGEEARTAIKSLRLQGETLFIGAQNVIEFWNGATRPTANNGFGLSPERAEAEVGALLALFPLASDTPDVFPQWRALVNSCGVIGVQVHDARLAALMLVHGLSHILTFNVRHLGRYGVLAVHPASVSGPAMVASSEE